MLATRYEPGCHLLIHYTVRCSPTFAALWLLSLLMIMVCPCAQADLRAGASRVDITPDIKAANIPLGGYAARKGAASTGVHDSVYAHALVLSSGNEKVAVVSLDLCFLPASVKSEVVKRLEAQARGWTAGSLFLAATHTHCGPDPIAMHAGNRFKLTGWTPFSASLLDFTADRIAAAIVQAEKAQRPASVGVGSIEAPTLNRNRRGEKTTDPALTLLKVVGQDGKSIAAVVNFAAHPTLYDDKMMEISADWPGVTATEVEKVLGDGSVCLFLNGAEGDASPNGVDDKQGDEKITTYGRKVADTVTGLLPSVHAQSTTESPSGPFRYCCPPESPTQCSLPPPASLAQHSARQGISSILSCRRPRASQWCEWVTCC